MLEASVASLTFAVAQASLTQPATSPLNTPYSPQHSLSPLLTLPEISLALLASAVL